MWLGSFPLPAFGGETFETFLDARYETRVFSLAEVARDPALLEGFDLLVWDSASVELPHGAFDPALVSGVLDFVREGGGLLLTGFAVQFVSVLGVEPWPPAGEAQWPAGAVVGLLTGRRVVHPAFQGLTTPSGNLQYLFLTQGSEGMQATSLFWSQRPPARGEVLAINLLAIDGKPIVPGQQVVLAQWRVGRGRILGLGHRPLFGERTRRTLERFLVQSIADLAPAGRERIRIARFPTVPPQRGLDLFDPASHEFHGETHALRRDHPGGVAIGAWGWLAPITYQRKRRDGIGEGPAYFRTRIVEASWKWGANLVEFYPPEMERGYPFPWPDDDPIPRPAKYWGGFTNPRWSPEAVRDFTRFAHERGMLVHTFFHPAPVPFETFPAIEDYLAVTRWFWREFAFPLKHGPLAAWDGFGYEGWFRDMTGAMNEALWRYNPGTYLHSTATRPRPTPNFSATIMAARGRFGNACGVSEKWRNRFPPPLYLSSQADCRTKKPSERTWGPHWGRFGGGSYPDWVVKQLFDFVRARGDLAPALWWLGEPEATLPAKYRPFVYGVSMDPLRAACAFRLTATGRGGYREVVAQLEGEAPAGFGAETNFPHDAVVLQNNHLRLVRLAGEDRGSLLFDPSGTAAFDRPPPASPPVLLSTNVLGTRTQGREAGGAFTLRIGKADDSAAEFAPEGGYARRLLLPLTAEGMAAERFPARIGYEADPAWPGEIVLRFTAPPGRYELAIGQLPAETPSLVEVFLDGETIGIYGVRGDRKGARHRLSFSLAADASPHELTLAVLQGGGHAFDDLVIERRSGLGITHSIPAAAGHLAELVETVDRPLETGRSREVRRWRIVADAPSLLVEVTRRCEGRARCRPHSSIATDGYETVILHSGGRSTPVSPGAGLPPGPLTLRLHDRQGRLPELALWIDRGEGTSVSIEKERIVLATERAEDHFTLGLLVLRDLYTPEDLGHLADLLPRGEVTLEGKPGETTIENPLPLPRIERVRIRNPKPGPYLVCEEGRRRGGCRWVTRGAQPMGGDDLLRVYLQPHGYARLQPFIDAPVRPGWGCQNTLAIGEGSDTRRRVEVLRLSPFLFAPRVRFSTPFSAVRVDGKPWFYFDEGVVFLPNRRGSFEVEVALEKGKERPHITRTFARIEAFSWDAAGATLSFEAEHPPFFHGPLPAQSRYYAEVRPGSYRLVGIEGGEILPATAWQEPHPERLHEGAIIRFPPGRVRLRFAPRKAPEGAIAPEP